MELELKGSDISLLDKRTEGWPAGLQMAALSLRGRTNQSEAIRSFSGSHRYVMDYLICEVLDGQTAEVQLFLLRTSMLERFCTELCDEVVERSGSQSILEELERSNLFIVALDDERRWYRYHHLFAQLLQHRLRLACTAEEVETLHLKAGRWLENAGDIETAMRHYLAGTTYREALRVVEDHHQRILTNGGLRQLLSWMSQVPEEVVGADAMSSILFGAFYAFAGKAVTAERWFVAGDSLLDRLEIGERSGRTTNMRGVAAAMRAFLSDMQGRTERAIR